VHTDKLTTLKGGYGQFNADYSYRKMDITPVQEPYLYQQEIKGVSRKYRTYSHGEGKRRAAIILANKNIGALLITQYSDKDSVLLEIQQGNEKFYAASI